MPTEQSVVVPPPFIWDPRSSPSSQDGEDDEIYDDHDDSYDYDDDQDDHNVAWQMDVRRNVKKSPKTRSSSQPSSGRSSSNSSGRVVAVPTTSSSALQLFPASPLSGGGGGGAVVDATDNDVINTRSVQERQRRKFLRSCHNNGTGWSDVSLRTQLWDAFRLTRVVLGEPIRGRRLTNHTILYAIQKVAAMKLQITQLQQLVDYYQQQHLEQYEQQDQQHHQQQLLLDQSPPQLQLDAQPNEELDQQQLLQLQKQHQSEQIVGNEVVVAHDNSTTILLKQQQEHEASMQALQLQLDTALEQLHHLKSLQKDEEHQLQSQQHQQQQLNGRDETKIIIMAPTTPSLSMPPSKRPSMNNNKDIRIHPVVAVIPKSKSHPDDGNTTNINNTGYSAPDKDIAVLRSIGFVDDDSKNNHYHERQQQQLLHISREIAGQQLYEREEHRKQLERQQREQHEEIESLLLQLHGRIQETSAISAAKFQTLHDQLTDAQIRQEALHKHQVQDLLDELQMNEQNHVDQIVAMQAQHDRTVMELQTQIQSYQVAAVEEQEQQQQSEVEQPSVQSTQRHDVDWSGEVIAANDVEQVLQTLVELDQKQRHQQALQRIDLRSHTIRSTGAIPTTSSDIDNETAEVNQRAIHLLSQMVRKPVRHTRQQEEQQQKDGPPEDLKKKFDDLTVKWTTAKQQRAATENNYSFLQLQKELMLMDMQGTRPAEDWTEMILTESEQYEQELNDMLVLEKHRVEEMEALDCELDHLALAAVHCEDLEQEFLDQQKAHKIELQKVREQSMGTIQRLHHLRHGVEESIVGVTHQEDVEQQSVDTVASAAELRIRLLERAVARRDDDLLQARAQLTLSQERIQAFETFSSSSGSTTKAGRPPRAGKGPTPVDYDTDSTAATGSTRSVSRVDNSNKSVKVGNSKAVKVIGRK
jgi:hypothetical protein